MLGRLAVTLTLLILLVASPLDAQNTACPTIDGLPNSGNDAFQCVAFGQIWVVDIRGFDPAQLISVFITGDSGLVSGADWTERVGPDGILHIEVDTRDFHGAELPAGDYRFFAKDFTGKKGSVQRMLRVLSAGDGLIPGATPSLATPPTPTAAQTQIVPTAGTTAPTPNVTLQPTGAAGLTPTSTLQPTGAAGLTPTSTLQPVGTAIGTSSPTLPAGAPTASPTSTVGPTMTLTPTSAQQLTNCDPSYPNVCIPSPPPELGCEEIPHSDFQVLPPDPHGFDRNQNGIGCESEPSD